MEKNPAHRIMVVLGIPYGWDRQPAKGVVKRRAKRKAQRKARKASR